MKQGIMITFIAFFLYSGTASARLWPFAWRTGGPYCMDCTGPIWIGFGRTSGPPTTDEINAINKYKSMSDKQLLKALKKEYPKVKGLNVKHIRPLRSNINKSAKKINAESKKNKKPNRKRR